jgi:hypothetical protein
MLKSRDCWKVLLLEVGRRRIKINLSKPGLLRAETISQSCCRVKGGRKEERHIGMNLSEPGLLRVEAVEKPCYRGRGQKLSASLFDRSHVNHSLTTTRA